MLVAQMAVRFCCQDTAVLVSEPSSNRFEIHASLDCVGTEKMSQRVMSEPWQPGPSTCRPKRLPNISDSKNAVFPSYFAALLNYRFQQPPKAREQRDRSVLMIFRANFAARHEQRVQFKIH